MPEPSPQAVRNGRSESSPRYGLTVSASPTAAAPSRRCSHASAYASAVEAMSPRLPSTTTSRPASRACAHTRSRAEMPTPPSASKKATWGFTATASSATASITPLQKRSYARARPERRDAAR